MSFLPKDYEKPASGGNYMKLEQGDNKLRIMSDAIVGWLDWDKTTGKPVPVRTKEKQAPLGEGKVKHFWAFIVFDYNEKRIKILEVTQSGIQNTIFSLHNDEQWGSPLNYDINVVRSGENLETKYQVLPSPPKEVAEDIKELYKGMNIDLEELFNGGDPFEKKISASEGMTTGIQKAKGNQALGMTGGSPLTEGEIDASNIQF